MPKCPRCGTEANKIRKKWNYSVFHVKSFNCEKCKSNFHAYYYQNKFSHLILNSVHAPRIRKKIIGYLKNHEYVREEEIANALHLDTIDVLKVLTELEKKGIVLRFVAAEDQ